jgi:hypothetical protein
VDDSSRSVQALLEKKNASLLPKGNLRRFATITASNILLDDVTVPRIDGQYPSIDTYIYWIERGLKDYLIQFFIVRMRSGAETGPWKAPELYFFDYNMTTAG